MFTSGLPEIVACRQILFFMFPLDQVFLQSQSHLPLKWECKPIHTGVVCCWGALETAGVPSDGQASRVQNWNIIFLILRVRLSCANAEKKKAKSLLICGTDCSSIFPKCFHLSKISGLDIWIKCQVLCFQSLLRGQLAFHCHQEVSLRSEQK